MEEFETNDSHFNNVLEAVAQRIHAQIPTPPVQIRVWCGNGRRGGKSGVAHLERQEGARAEIEGAVRQCFSYSPRAPATVTLQFETEKTQEQEPL